MRSSKKLIIIIATVASVLALTLSGVAFAQTGDAGDSQPQDEGGVLLDRVCEIYEENTGVTLNPEELQNAFAQAGAEMRGEAMEARLQNLVEQGKITQEEADQYLEWWESKPDTKLPGPFGFSGVHGFCGGMRGMFQNQFQHNFGLRGPIR